MPDDHSKSDKTSDIRSPQKLGQTVLEDLNQIDFRRTMREDLEDVYHFYLDSDTRNRLDEMDQVSRWLHLTGWLLKNSILKLPSVRRLLLLVGLFAFLWGTVGDAWGHFVGFIILLLVLVLELKDKLLAQDELLTGRAVQFALMPREQPSIPGWETWLYTHPAKEVGGDLVDYLKIDEDRMGLALGDVAGKGLGAALVMAKLQSTLRAIAPGLETLSELGQEVNNIFVRDGLPDRFISLVYLIVTPDAGRVRVLNAGHMPPLRAFEGGVEEMPRGAPALGLTGAAVYTEQYVDLQPGDVLLVYSDGLSEARNEQGDFYGEERVQALLPSLRGLSAEAAGQCLLEAIERFIGEARPHDDLSIILLKRASDPVRLPARSVPVDDGVPSVPE